MAQQHTHIGPSGVSSTARRSPCRVDDVNNGGWRCSVRRAGPRQLERRDPRQPQRSSAMRQRSDAGPSWCDHRAPGVAPGAV